MLSLNWSEAGRALPLFPLLNDRIDHLRFSPDPDMPKQFSVADEYCVVGGRVLRKNWARSLRVSLSTCSRAISLNASSASPSRFLSAAAVLYMSIVEAARGSAARLAASSLGASLMSLAGAVLSESDRARKCGCVGVMVAVTEVTMSRYQDMHHLVDIVEALFQVNQHTLDNKRCYLELEQPHLVLFIIFDSARETGVMNDCACGEAPNIGSVWRQKEKKGTLIRKGTLVGNNTKGENERVTEEANTSNMCRWKMRTTRKSFRREVMMTAGAVSSWDSWNPGTPPFS